eukprot:scaffold672012_cov41-Prasinocladus_malaysianus.AAC.1
MVAVCHSSYSSCQPRERSADDVEQGGHEGYLWERQSVDTMTSAWGCASKYCRGSLSQAVSMSE